MGAPSQQLLTVKETAARLAVSTVTIRRLCAVGALPVVRVGRAVRLPESAVTAFVERQRQAAD